jgi:hypothetical protein
MMWTEGGQVDHLTFAGLRGGGGKGGKQQTVQDTSGTTNTTGTSETQLPPWLTGAAQQAVGTAQTLSQDPNLFAPYQGQQVADVSQGTQLGFNYGIGNDPTQMAGQVGGAANSIYGAIAGMAQPQQQQYLQQGLQQAQGLLGGWAGQGPASAASVAQDAQSMMSPYTQAVIDPTMALGRQALTQNLQQVGAQANQAGAFGGSRQGVQEGVAQSQAALGESAQLGNLLNTGYGQALTQAGNLANTRQQLGESAASTLGQMYGNAGSAMAGYGQADMNNALQAGQGIPQQYLQNLLGIGGLQQSQQQALLNSQMGTYYGQQQQPIQNLDLLLSAVSGVPYGTSGSSTGTGQTTGTGTTTATTTPSTVDQIGSYIGLIGKVAGAAGAFA